MEKPFCYAGHLDNPSMRSFSSVVEDETRQDSDHRPTTVAVENPKKPSKGIFLGFLLAAGLVVGGVAGITVVVAAIAYFTGHPFKNDTNISAVAQRTVSTALPKGTLL